jgi:hypothetical protein
MAVHTGTDDLSGPWYGFWSGFGSDLAEIGVIGAVATGVYQIFRKYNPVAGAWARIRPRTASSSFATDIIPTSGEGGRPPS